MFMNNSMTRAEKGAAVSSRPRLARRPAGPYVSIWVATALLFVASWILVPKSVTGHSLDAMLPFWGVLAIIAAGQTLVIQQRGIDLSVPGMVTLAAMVFVYVTTRHDAPFLVAFLVVIGVAAVVGIANGLIVTRLNITPLITTLAMNALLTGAMYSYTKGAGGTAPQGLQSFVGSDLLGIPTLAWIAVGVVAAVALVARRSKFGRRFVAVGANPLAARALGIRVNAYIVGAYVGAAMLFAAAAVLLVGYVSSSTPTLGNPYLFQSVMAVVIGGTSIAGGRGSAAASAVAALFLTQLGQVVLTLGAAASVQLLVQAIAMAVALAGAAVVNSRRAG
jgi:ribose transport system permease protein